MQAIGKDGVPLSVFGRGSLRLDSRTDTHELINLVNENRRKNRNTMPIVATDGRPPKVELTRKSIVSASKEYRL